MIKAVVNFNIGCYEEVIEPTYENPTWDFYTITDLEQRDHRKCSSEYFFEPLIYNDARLEGLSAKRKASFYKAKALSLVENITGIDYDIVLTIDSNVEINGDLDKLLDEHHTNSDISMPIHPDCESYLAEVEKIRQIRSECGKEIENDEDMEATIDEMMRQGFKFDNGYHESTMSIRTNSKRTKAFEKAWAKNYLALATKRDQPSLSLTRFEKKTALFHTIKHPLNHTWTNPFLRHPHKYNA